MKAILVPTDFSACAANAVRLAHSIAQKAGAHLYFLHMFTDFSEPVHVPHSSDHIIARHPKEGRCRARLKQLVTEAEQEGIEASSIFVYDHGTEKVSDYLESYDIDLVVMGTHGIGGLKEWLTGSNARYLTRHTTVPVLVLKHVPESFEIGEILFPSRFHHDMTDSLGKVSELASLFDAQVHLLYVHLNGSDKNAGQEAHILDYFQGEFPDNRMKASAIDTNDELWGIEEFIHTWTTDIVAVSRKEHNATIFSRSIAESLIKREDVPILIV